MEHRVHMAWREMEVLACDWERGVVREYLGQASNGGDISQQSQTLGCRNGERTEEKRQGFSPKGMQDLRYLLRSSNRKMPSDH